MLAKVWERIGCLREWKNLKNHSKKKTGCTRKALRKLRDHGMECIPKLKSNWDETQRNSIISHEILQHSDFKNMWKLTTKNQHWDKK